MKKLFPLPLLFLLAFTTSISKAQQTGDFYIGFPSPDTLLTDDSVHLYFHVPVSYQPGVPLKLIVGIHGAGNPNKPEQIRNYFSPTADSMSAIVVCPKPYLGDQPRSHRVVDITIDSVLQWYTIDTSEIYIAGYSAGSDVAANYTLNNPKHQMKGLIWYAPGFFFKPNLSAQTTFPATCLCFGDTDPISNILGQVTSIRDSFANSSFDFFYNEIPGINHTMEFPNFTREMLECFRFMNDPVNFTPDSSYVGESVLPSESFRFFPNPTSGKLIFEGAFLREADKLQIVDVNGKNVFETTELQTKRLEINLSGNKPGTYLLQLTIADGQYNYPIVLTGE